MTRDAGAGPERQQLAALIARDVFAETGCSCARCQWQGSLEVAMPPAELLAAVIFRHRTRGTSGVFTAWEDWRSGGKAPDAVDALTIPTFIRPGFGLPASPGTDDHVEGLIGEYLWWVVVSELEHALEVVVPSDGPGLLPTKPGGDGLLVHRAPDGALLFRLWELKKYTGSSGGPGPTVTRACGQLNEKAVEYLAQYAADASDRGVADPDVAELFAMMARHWVQRAESASAGIGLATNHDPAGCISGVHTHFTSEFHRLHGLEGLAVWIPDFPAFAQQVRNELWKPLT